MVNCDGYCVVVSLALLCFTPLSSSENNATDNATAEDAIKQLVNETRWDTTAIESDPFAGEEDGDFRFYEMETMLGRRKGRSLNASEVFETDPLIAELLRDYNRFETPHKGKGQPTVVKLGVYVNSFYSISESTMDYSLSIYLRQSWEDPRLAFYAPNKNITLKLHDGMWGLLWTPDVFFRNEKIARFHEATRPNRMMTLDSQGRIWYVIKLSLTLDCQMCLLKFPMDQQSCPMKMESFGYKSQTISFEWFNPPVEIDDDVQLPQFQLANTTTKNCSQHYVSGDYSCLRINFILKRDFGYYLTQMYIPTILIVVLSWVGFWISIDAVPARVSLGLLTVLTITTQRSAATSSLPRVSYVKAMDVWMATCLVFVFASFLEFAVISFVSNVDETSPVMKRKQRKQKKKARSLPSPIEVIKRARIHRPPNHHNVFPKFERSIDASEFEMDETETTSTYDDTTEDTSSKLTSVQMDASGEIIYDSKQIKAEMEAKEVLVLTQRRKAQRIDALSRWLFPTLFAFFNISYWFIYLSQKGGSCNKNNQVG